MNDFYWNLPANSIPVDENTKLYQRNADMLSWSRTDFRETQHLEFDENSKSLIVIHVPNQLRHKLGSGVIRDEDNHNFPPNVTRFSDRDRVSGQPPVVCAGKTK
jgi:hypothetical protein